MPLQIHSYREEAERYLGGMIEEYDVLNRRYESLEEEHQITLTQLDELRNRNTEDLPLSSLTEQELQVKIEALEALVVELTQKLEEKIDAKTD